MSQEAAGQQGCRYRIGKAASKLRQAANGPAYLCSVKYIFYAILIYLAYQLIFRLIIPVYFASRKIKQQFREMQDRMEEQRQRQEDFRSPQQKPPPATGASPGDYIEFEEVK